VTPSTLPELRVVLDTQVLLRGAMAKSASLTSKIYDAWREGHFLLLLSEPIFQEIEDVVGRPEVLQKLRFSPVEAGALLLLLQRRGQFVTPQVVVRQSRDPADDKFLECALTGQAHYVVSADGDLLSLTAIQDIPIVDVPTFWRVLQSRLSQDE
jgi:putative PIN family toxin of toxin-antitoxin system